MDVVVAAVGRLKAGPERELCDRYLDRARRSGRALGLRGFAVEEMPESRAARSDDRVVEEARALLERYAEGARLVCLDAGGELADSDAFAQALSKDADAAVPRTVFVIGGPDGLGRALLARADRRLSFGRLTWPHQLVRILLAEQLYRATTILSGHPYHRA
jgi:23S rRNA (pseudouridine1915-N3)-methyltransferase